MSSNKNIGGAIAAQKRACKRSITQVALVMKSAALRILKGTLVHESSRTAQVLPSIVVFVI